MPADVPVPQTPPVCSGCGGPLGETPVWGPHSRCYCAACAKSKAREWATAYVRKGRRYGR